MNKTFKAVLIDDEDDCIRIIEKILKKHCADIEICGEANIVSDAVDLINKCKPDLVFLDIQMPDGDGFDVLEKVSHTNFEVVFVTAHDQHAIRAFRFSALNYLLKPIDPVEIVETVKRFKRRSNPVKPQSLGIFKEAINNNIKRIILPTSEGTHMVEIKDIVRCEADSNYTTFYISDTQKVVVSSSLGTYEKLLVNHNFTRIHNKHLVNLLHIKKFLNTMGGMVKLSNGEMIDVSTRKRHELITRMKEFAGM